MMKRVHVVILVIVIAIGCIPFGVLKFKTHPAISFCEKILLDNLKSPSSYKALKQEMHTYTLTNDKNIRSRAYVKIEYEAANSFNASIKDEFICTMGMNDHSFLKDNEKLKLESMRFDQFTSIGKSPFDALIIVEIRDNNKMWDKQLIPFEARQVRNTGITTPHSPGYIVGWHGYGPFDYILSDNPPTPQEKEAAAKRFAEERERLSKMK